MKQDIEQQVRRAIDEVVAAGLDSSTNELQTRYAAIDPMLDALGWSRGDPTQVAVEYSPAKSQVRVDYALLDRKRERVFRESRISGGLAPILQRPKTADGREHRETCPHTSGRGERQ